MIDYRVFFIGANGRVAGVSSAAFATSDEASRWARTLDDGRTMELWCQDKRLEIIAPLQQPRSASGARYQ